MNETHQRHPFLDDLAEDAELSSSVLRDVVKGRQAIRLAVEAVGGLYQEQKGLFQIQAGNRSILEYEALLRSGGRLRATVVIERRADGLVASVSVRMSPLGAVLALGAALRPVLEGSLPEQVFL